MILGLNNSLTNCLEIIQKKKIILTFVIFTETTTFFYELRLNLIEHLFCLLVNYNNSGHLVCQFVPPSDQKFPLFCTLICEKYGKRKSFSSALVDIMFGFIC